MDGLVLEWLEGLASYSPVFIELLPGKKVPSRPWAIFEAAHLRQGGTCLQAGLGWLRRGKGLGFLPRGCIWILDIDSPEEVERYLCSLAKSGVFPPYVRTPSGGAHLYFRYPVGFDRRGLKNHVCHPLDPDGEKLPIDFKLGPRTLVVAPGSVRSEGPYLPMTSWREPPELGPERIFPSGEFWRSEDQPFLTYERPLKARIARACAYLPRLAPIAVSGCGGRRTLAGVCAHLVAFLKLDPALAVYLLTHGPNPWNGRCRHQDGTPYPWSQDELWQACSDAVDAIPRAGVVLHQRASIRNQRDSNLRTFSELMRGTHQVPEARMVKTETLCSMFNSWAGVEFAVNAFSRGIANMGIRPKFFSRRRISGVNLDFEAFQSLLRSAGAPCNETRNLSTAPQSLGTDSGYSAEDFGALDEFPFLHNPTEVEGPPGFSGL